MESFYGGKPGASFVIVKEFSSVANMIEAFAQGPAYTEVNYDEYIVINQADDKRSAFHGNVYRRGYDYTNEMGGAIYVGNISGPAGYAPEVRVASYSDVRAQFANLLPNDDNRQGTYNYSLQGGDLLPGNEYDEIEWIYCSVRDEDNSDTVAWVGFKIPYLVVDFDSEVISHYDSVPIRDTENNLINPLTTRDDDKTKPFYEHWHIKVPHGIKGESFRNFRVIAASNDDNVETYEGQESDREKGRQILVFDYYNYDEVEDPEPQTIYLGDYNKISSVDVDEKGTLTVKYTHDNDYIADQRIKWIDEVSLTSTGIFTIIYNNTEEIDGEEVHKKYQTTLKWVEDISLSGEGVVTVTYNTKDGNDINESKDFDQKLKWITSIVMNQYGVVTVNYNTKQNDEYDKDVLNDPLRWINAIEMNDEGNIIVTYNTLDSEGEIEKTILPNIKWIDNIYINSRNNYFDEDNNFIEGEEGTGDQRIHIVYNTKLNDPEKNDIVSIGEPLNYIMKTAINPVNYHFLVYYSDPARRNPAEHNDIVTFNDEIGWVDLGAVRENSGLLVGMNIDKTATIENPLYQEGGLEPEYLVFEDENGFIKDSIVCESLNKLYPNGLGRHFDDALGEWIIDNQDIFGKVITIGLSGTDDKKFYSYDYSTLKWEPLGGFTQQEINGVFFIGSEEELMQGSNLSDLKVGSLWFETEKRQYLVVEEELNG